MKKMAGYCLLGIAILTLILVPFMLWGTAIERGVDDFVKSAGRRPLLVAAVLGGLLASDILLPIPSSLVSTSTGVLLGFMWGTLVSFAGMTVSCVAGYWLGARGGRPLGRRLVGDGDLRRLETFSRRFGDFMIVVARSVPVLAEASVIFAGMGRMPFRRFFIMTMLADLGISAVYAAVGAFASAAESFLLAFAGALVLPLLALVATRAWRKH